MIRILIVADIRLYREGLAESLGRRERMQVVGTRASSQEATAALDECQPDVVLVDMAMQEGVTIARALLDHRPQVRVVALAVPEVEREMITCAELGVSGLVPREASLDDLVETLESAARGEVRCSPRMTGVLLRRLAALASGQLAAGHSPPLTTRERDVVDLVDHGLSNKEIARRLGIEVATVKNHVHNILEKLQVHRRGEAAARVRGGAPRRTPA